MLKLLKRLALGLVAFCVLLCALLVAAYVFRAPLLRRAAATWIVNQPLSKADVIVVLGGGLDSRPFEAARLFQLGLAPRILLMKPRLSAVTELGLMPSEADLARGILMKKGIPASAIFVTSDLVTNSYDESIALRNWARTHGVKTAIIPADIFHTRRVCWLYGQELQATGIRVEIEAAPVRQYTANDWWRHEEGLIAFQNEVLKFAYYRVKY
jgi:uncharacterized SAM-binding protein YcdF (DUF218 family)